MFQEADRLKAKKEKLAKQEIFQIKSMKRSIKSREEELAERERKRDEKREADKSKTKKLSKFKYPLHCVSLLGTNLRELYRVIVQRSVIEKIPGISVQVIMFSSFHGPDLIAYGVKFLA